tara:strand:- start:981 stop:1418 length:438 start_codon:yes stop_codon:yes gene_type:complete
MPSIKLSLNQDYLTLITRGNASQGTIYKRTIPTQYYTANKAITDVLKVLRDTTIIRVVYKDCVTGLRYEINSLKSAPPEDKYKGLPATTRYIPDRLITLVAECNSVYIDNVKKSKIKYLMSEYDSKRINAETFERKLNQVINRYR